MATSPPPIKDPFGSQRWLDWFLKVNNRLNIVVGTWTELDKSGSNLTDIVTRNHNDLQSIQGGSTTERYHLTLAQHTSLTNGDHNNLSSIQGGNPTERYHLTQEQHDQLRLNKYDATTAPGTGDDSGDGFDVGSIWVDVAGDDAYICVDASVGSAVWKQITA